LEYTCRILYPVLLIDKLTKKCHGNPFSLQPGLHLHFFFFFFLFSPLKEEGYLSTLMYIFLMTLVDQETLTGIGQALWSMTLPN